MQALCPGTQQQYLLRGITLAWLTALLLLALPTTARSEASGDDTCTLLYDQDDPALFDFVNTRQKVDFSQYQGMTIGDIHYAVLPIFNEKDPAEDNWLYRLANLLHIDTRDTTLRKQMILARGKPLDRDHVRENERLLRANEYLVDAMILPHRVCADQIDLLVVVRDVWTFSPSASASRSGGDDSTSGGITETNLLGTGQRISAGYFDDADRSGHFFSYRNPLLPGRVQLNLSYTNATDGDSVSGGLVRPFYQLDSRWSGGVTIQRDSLLKRIEVNDETVNRYRLDDNRYEAFVGWSPGVRDQAINRWRLGIADEEERFGAVAQTTSLPDDERRVYPWLSWEYQENRHLVASNLNRAERQEDIRLGWYHFLRLGYATEAMGSNTDSLLFSASTSNTRFLHAQHLIRTGMYTNGRHEEGDFISTFYGANLDYYYFLNHNNRWFARLDLDAGSNLRQDEELTIGGNDNLRGYPSDYQRGDRRWVFSVERRRFTNWQIFNLAYVGGAVYVDAGQAWIHGQARGSTLANAGLGLRLSPSKFRVDRVLHLDVAAPLVDQDQVDDVQFIVSGKVDF
ncbi:MAG: hypothetical protein MI745_13095 [Pseudomonadales bacterium]|nr:hypothetical protein [Pseudomonadales bacterium]